MNHDRLRQRLLGLPIIKNPAFRNPDYLRLWAGAGGNHLGMSGEQVVLGLLVFGITGSTAWVGTVLAIYYLPLFVFGVLSGTLADWMDRRALLRRIEFCILLNLLVFAGLAAIGLLHLGLILAFTIISGSLRAMHQPVRISYAYDIVGGEQVVSGLGLLNLASRLGQLIGALLAGSIMERLGTPAAFLALGAVHLGSFALFCRLESAGSEVRKEATPIGRTLREFFQEMRGNRVLSMLVLLTASVEVFGFSFTTVLPELATERFGLGAEGLGLMHATRALGGLLAGLTLAGMSEPKRRGLIYLALIYAFGGSLVLLAGSENLSLALLALLLVAAFATASDVLTQSMIQLSVADHLRGRAMGAWVLAIGTAPLGHLEMGVLAVALGVGGALFANGAALVVLAVITTLVVPRLRKL